MELRWLRRALGDLDRIAAYIAQDNPQAAHELVRAIQKKTSRLSEFPFLGRASERTDIRELVVHEHYLVSYRLRREAIEILQVWHAAQERGGEPKAAAPNAGVSPSRRIK